MSRILALDTSTDACSVALAVDGEVHAEFVIEPRRHTHLLLPMVERVLAVADLKVAQLDAIAFGRGPGSFAGIRIATGAAQGLALGADLPLLPVSTLEAMAISVRDELPGRTLITALDARMDEVYWAAYQLEQGELRVLVEEQVCAPQQVQLPAGITNLVALGSGWRYCEQMGSEVRAAVVEARADCYPDARAMLLLAEAQWRQGRGVAPEQALPVYLRDGTWKKKDQQ